MARLRGSRGAREQKCRRRSEWRVGLTDISRSVGRIPGYQDIRYGVARQRRGAEVQTGKAAGMSITPLLQHSSTPRWGGGGEGGPACISHRLSAASPDRTVSAALRSVGLLTVSPWIRLSPSRRLLRAGGRWPRSQALHPPPSPPLRTSTPLSTGDDSL
jgi:hypothetical protein